jgi:predicted oxidoreductase
MKGPCEMKNILIPHTELEVSPLAFGCMGLGGGFTQPSLTAAHEQQVRQFLDTAAEVGVNFFDHADVYAFGRAEEVFGTVLKERPSLRDQIVIQSKCGIRRLAGPDGKSVPLFDFSHEHIISSAEGILRRLGTEHLDILLLHRPDALLEGEEVARAFADLKQSGKVGYFGVSNQNRHQMEYLQSFLPDPLVANQIQMSLLHSGFIEQGISFNQAAPAYPDGLEGLSEYCSMQGVQLQAWAPLARGLLSGAALTGQPDAVIKTAAMVKNLAAQYSVSAEAIVLAWLLRHPAGIQPVLGSIQPERLRACAQATTIKLSRLEWYGLLASARGLPMP